MVICGGGVVKVLKVKTVLCLCGTINSTTGAVTREIARIGLSNLSVNPFKFWDVGWHGSQYGS
jgi:hypothetical protein